MWQFIYIDGEFIEKFDSPKEVNEANLGRVAIQKSEQREDGDYNLYMVTIPE